MIVTANNARNRACKFVNSTICFSEVCRDSARAEGRGAGRGSAVWTSLCLLPASVPLIGIQGLPEGALLAPNRDTELGLAFACSRKETVHVCVLN